MNTSGMFLALALLAGADAAQPEKAALKLNIEAETQVPFGEPVTLDASKSEGVVDLTFKVYPRKKVFRDSAGRQAYFFGKPGRYTVLIVASDSSGKQQDREIEIEVQAMTVDEWRSLAPPEAADAPAISRQSPNTAAQPAVLQRPALKPDPIGIRQEVRDLLGKVEGFSAMNERQSIATGYDRVGAELLAKHDGTKEQWLAIISRALDTVDPAVRDKWRPFSIALRQLLEDRADEGRLPDHNAYAQACQTVQDVLEEVR